MSSLDRSTESEGASPDRAVLLDIARQSIALGLQTGQPLVVDPDDYPPELGQPLATFVTLRRAGELRGCLGGLEANRPLVSDVAHSAFGAAFRDNRFAPVTADELDQLEIHISILSPLEPLSVPDEVALLDAIRRTLSAMGVERPGRGD